MAELKEHVSSECAALFEKLASKMDSEKPDEAVPHMVELIETLGKFAPMLETLSKKEMAKEAAEAKKLEAESAKKLAAKPARAAPMILSPTKVVARVTRAGKAAAAKQPQPKPQPQPKSQQPKKAAADEPPPPPYRVRPAKAARDALGKAILADLLGGKHEDWHKRHQAILGALRAFVATYERKGRIGDVLPIIGQGLVATIMDAHSQVQLAALATVIEFACEYKSAVASLALAADKKGVTVLDALLKTSAFKASGEVRKAAVKAAESLLSNAPSVDVIVPIVKAGESKDKMIVACAANLHVVLIENLPREKLVPHLEYISKSLGKLLVTASPRNDVSDNAKEAVLHSLADHGGEYFVAARNIVDKIPNDNRVLRDALTDKLDELEAELRAEPLLSTDERAGASAAADPTALRTGQIGPESPLTDEAILVNVD